MRFEVLPAVTSHIIAFWDETVLSARDLPMFIS